MTKEEIEVKLELARTELTKHEVGSVQHDMWRLKVKEYEELLETQSLPATMIGKNVCLHCEG